MWVHIPRQWGLPEGSDSGNPVYTFETPSHEAKRGNAEWISVNAEG